MQTRRQAAAATSPDEPLTTTHTSESGSSPEQQADDLDQQSSPPTASTSNPIHVLEHIPKGPCTTSWSHYSAIPEECKNRVEVCLGVDEAGRGPVLGDHIFTEYIITSIADVFAGPMVYAASYVPVARKDDLALVGFAGELTRSVDP